MGSGSEGRHSGRAGLSCAQSDLARSFVAEREIFETLRKIRDRDPSIYDKSAKFYTDLPTPEDSGDAGCVVMGGDW